MSQVTIQIGDRSVDVSAVPLGGLRKILVAIHRVSVSLRAGILDESLIDDVILILSVATKIPIEELELVETNLPQVQAAVIKVIEVSGLGDLLKPDGGSLGGVVSEGLLGSPPSTSSTQP